MGKVQHFGTDAYRLLPRDVRSIALSCLSWPFGTILQTINTSRLPANHRWNKRSLLKQLHEADSDSPQEAGFFYILIQQQTAMRNEMTLCLVRIQFNARTKEQVTGCWPETETCALKNKEGISWEEKLESEKYFLTSPMMNADIISENLPKLFQCVHS